jgi:hypothetical protein
MPLLSSRPSQKTFGVEHLHAGVTKGSSRKRLRVKHALSSSHAGFVLLLDLDLSSSVAPGGPKDRELPSTDFLRPAISSFQCSRPLVLTSARGAHRLFSSSLQHSRKSSLSKRNAGVLASRDAASQIVEVSPRG